MLDLDLGQDAKGTGGEYGDMMGGWWGEVDGGPWVYLHAVCAGHQGHISQ